MSDVPARTKSAESNNFATGKTNDPNTAGTHGLRQKSHRQHPLLQFHQTIGNQAVGRLLNQHAFQAKLKIGQPNDRFEQEADRVADQVMRMPIPEATSLAPSSTASPTSPAIVERVCSGCQDELPRMPVPVIAKIASTSNVHRACAECEEELQRQPEEEEDEGELLQRQQEQEDEQVQTKQHAGATPPVTPSVESGIQSLKGAGRPLSDSQRAFFEPRFGASFSQVRIHTDQNASNIARSINAHAFTIGNHIAFAREQLTPTGSEGNRLLAHELAHTVQQSGGARASAGAIQRTIGDGHDLTAPRFSGNVRLEAVFDDERVLKNGNSGTAVELVQQALVDLGYDLPRFGVDGEFGDETEAAVRAFQVDTGAGVDGVVGFETIGFLDARVQGQPVVAPPAPVVGAALPADNVIVQPGAAPSRPVAGIGPCIYGLAFPENVQIELEAVRNGANWEPVVTGLTGNYSLQARLIPTVAEVTGPAGNTTAGNFCDQVTDLNHLVNTGGCALNWYMRSAIVAHERVHATFFRPALVAVAPAIEAAIEAITVPNFVGLNAAVAQMLIRIQPAFIVALTNAQTVWLAQILASGAGHPAIDANTAAAERTIVDPMIRRICRHARAQGWPACRPPC